MKKVQKGFTLVELIVVITILAILGTIAFISLQGYSQDAKNSKVSSDIRTLASAIETKLTESSISIHDLNDDSGAGTYDGHGILTNTNTFASGVTLSGATHEVGNIAFSTLGQNGEDFTDPNGQEYIIATLTQTANNPNTASTDAETFVMYQLVGEAGGADTRKAVVKGNYLYNTAAANDVDGLVGSGTTAITNDLPLTISLY